MFKLCLQAQIGGLFVLSYTLLMLGPRSHEEAGEGTPTIGAGSCCSNRFCTACRKKYVSLSHWICSTLEAIRENVNTYATISAIH